MWLYYVAEIYAVVIGTAEWMAGRINVIRELLRILNLASSTLRNVDRSDNRMCRSDICHQYKAELIPSWNGCIKRELKTPLRKSDNGLVQNNERYKSEATTNPASSIVATDWLLYENDIIRSVLTELSYGPNKEHHSQSPESTTTGN